MLELFPGVRVLAPSATPERARAQSWSLGAGRAVVVEEAARLVERRIAGPDPTSGTFKLMLQTRGHARLAHCGRSALLEPGDLVLLDGARHFSMELEPGYRQAVLELPRNLVGRRCQSLLGVTGQRLAAAEPAHRLLFQASQAIVDQLQALSAAQRAPLLDAVLGLLAAFAGACAQPESELERRFARARADLEAHLSDPELGAALLAQLQGISRRHLDAIFAARGQSAERLIWERRLERVSDELRSPAHAHRPLVEIAFAWGFNSQSHFSRSFRRRFGQSPSAFRRQPAAG